MLFLNKHENSEQNNSEMRR